MPWRPFLSEAIGTAQLVLFGLTLLILMFGTSSPMPAVVPSEGLRRLITGFLFGTTGALIALSPVGEVSRAHINPVVTFGFRLMAKIDSRVTLRYILAQLVGGIIGCVPLRAWGAMGRSVSFAATTPGPGYSSLSALAGEIVMTFIMVVLLAVFLGFRLWPASLAVSWRGALRPPSCTISIRTMTAFYGESIKTYDHLRHTRRSPSGSEPRPRRTLESLGPISLGARLGHRA